MTKSKPGLQLPFDPPARFDIIRIKQVYKRRGRSRSGHYADVKAKLFPSPFKVGRRGAGNADYEIDIMNRAEASGKTEEYRRALVEALESVRAFALAEDLL